MEYQLDNGAKGSRSAYIRQEFAKDRSRKDIAAELGVKYYIVYSATANMFNAAHPEGGTGKGGAVVPKVDAKFNYINAEGEIVDTAEEAVQVPRTDMMRELLTAGVTRTQIKDYFDVPYATVYAATKEVDAPAGTVKGGKKFVTHKETGEQIARTDYIRELYAEGMGRKEIALFLTELTGELVDYAVVWSATKEKKEEAEVEEIEDETASFDDIYAEEDEDTDYED